MISAEKLARAHLGGSSQYSATAAIAKCANVTQSFYRLGLGMPSKPEE